MIFIIFGLKRNLIRVTRFLYRNFDPTWRLIAIKIPSFIREKNALVLLFPPITNPSNLETIFLLPRHNSIQSGIKSQTNNALIILPNGLERYIYIYIYIIRKWRTENGNRGFRILFPRVVLPPPPFETPMPTRAHGHVHLSAGYKRIASCARVCTHAEKAVSDAYTRVCTRESIVRPTEEVRGWQATASRHFLLFFFSPFR